MRTSKIWESSSDPVEKSIPHFTTSNSAPSALTSVPSIAIHPPAEPVERSLSQDAEDRHLVVSKRSYTFSNATSHGSKSSSSSSRMPSPKDWNGIVCTTLTAGKSKSSQKVGNVGELDEGVIEHSSDSESMAKSGTAPETVVNSQADLHEDSLQVRSRMNSCRSSKASVLNKSNSFGLRSLSQRFSNISQNISHRWSQRSSGNREQADRSSQCRRSKTSMSSKASSPIGSESQYMSTGTVSGPLGFWGRPKGANSGARSSNLLLSRIAQASSFVKPTFLKKEELDFRTTLTKTNCADVFHIRADYESLQEQQAQLQNMLQPHGRSTWRLSLLGTVGIRYDKVMIFLTMLTLIYAPLQLAVESLCSRRERGSFALLKALHLVCTVVYAFLALVVRFAFTAVDVPFGVELFNISDIIALVLKEKCFWLDVFSALSLPFEIYHMTVEADHPTWVQVLIALLTLCRSWRFVYRGLHVDTRGEAWRSRLYFELLGKFGSLLLLFHFFACFWALVSNIEHNSNVSSWLADRDDSCGRLYLESLYFMITTATSVGFGDTVPVNGFERVVCVIMMITGQMIMAEIFAHMNWVTSVVNFDRARHIRKVTKTCASLNSLQVPWSIANRVLAFIDYTGITRKDLAVKGYLEDLSYPLRTEILLTMYYDLVIACPFFKDQSFDVILFVMHSLVDQAYLPGDVIFKSSSVARELFFIRSGEVALVAKLVPLTSLGNESSAKMLKSGDYFGETCMLMGTRYNVNAMTTCYCLLSILSQDGIQGLEKRFPNGFLMLVKSAQEVCKTRSALTWARVFEVLHDRFESTEEAYQWMSTDAHDGLNAIQFADGLSKLGIKRFDAQVLWAGTIDKIQCGFMPRKEFCAMGSEHREQAAVVASLSQHDAPSAILENAEEELKTPKSPLRDRGREKLKRLFTLGSIGVKHFIRRKGTKSTIGGNSSSNHSLGEGLARCNTVDFENHYTKAERQESLQLDKVLKTKGAGRLSLLSNYGLLYQRFLRQLAVIMVLLAPCQVCFEAGCKEDERQLAFKFKVILLICSAVYSSLALAGRYVFAVVNMQKGMEMHDFRDVMATTCKSWKFWLDLIAACSLPFEIVQLSREPTSPAWSDCFILLTLLRSWRLFVVVVRLHARVNITMEIGWLFVFLLLQIHIVACAWGLLGIVQWQARLRGEHMENNWIDHAISRKILPSDCGCVELYVSSLYFASSTFSSVGYGDIYAVNNSEYVVVVVMMLFSQVVIAQVFAMLNWTTSTGRQIHAEHVSKVCYISAALNDLQIPKVLRQRVLAVTDYAQACQRQKPILPLLKELPPPLQLMVRSALYSGLVRGCPFFHNMGQDAIDLVIRSLVDRAYLPNDFVFSEGDLGDDMYFIRTGEVSLIKASSEYSRLSSLDFSDEVLRLKPGAYFGELAALMGGARRKLTAVSFGYSILSLLSADAFRTLEQDHPVPFVKLVRNAQDMLKSQQQPSFTWDQISRMVGSRGMTIEQTFEWIQAGKGIVDHISIASFTDAMRKLGVDRFSAHALWIEADVENDGFLTYEEFDKCMRKNHDVMVVATVPRHGNHKKRKLSALPAVKQAKMVSMAPYRGSIASSVMSLPPPLSSAPMSSPSLDSQDTLGTLASGSISMTSETILEEEEEAPGREGFWCEMSSGQSDAKGATRVTLSEVRRSIKNARTLAADGTVFGLRMYAEEAEQDAQLDQMLYTSQHRSRLSIVGYYGRLYLRCLTMLVSVTCIYIPLQLAIEPAADVEEQRSIQSLKMIHLVFSLLYTLVAIPCRLCFTVADLSQCVELHLLREVINSMVCSKGLWLDLIATMSIPFECIHLCENESSPTTSQYFMCIALLRSWRIFRPEVSMNHGHRSLYREIVFLPVVLVMEIHLMACLWAYLGLVEYRNSGTWWLQSLGMESIQTCVSLYVQSVYFVGYTVTGVGYGDLVPVNAQERVIAVLIMILGQMSIAELFAQITWVTQIYNCIRAEHASKTLRLTDALHQLRLADDFQKRVIAYTDYCHLYMKEAAVRMHFEDLSPPLLNELRLVVNFELVINCPFFQDEPVTVVRQLVNLLKEQAYLPQDFVFREGGTASEMYLIRTGTVSMCSKKDQSSMSANDFEIVASLVDGDHFGEVGLLTGSPHRLNALATSYCNLSFLTREDFETMDYQCPGFSLTFVKSAKAFIPELLNRVSWTELAKHIVDKFGDPFTAFSWMCRDESEPNTMTLEAFRKGLEVLGYSRYAANCFWSSCRKSHSTKMDLQFFTTLINQHSAEPLDKEKGSIVDGSNSASSLACITEDQAENTPGVVQDKTRGEIGASVGKSPRAADSFPSTPQSSHDDGTNMHCSETPSIEHVSEPCTNAYVSNTSASIVSNEAKEKEHGCNEASEMPYQSLENGSLRDDGCLEEDPKTLDDTWKATPLITAGEVEARWGSTRSDSAIYQRNDDEGFQERHRATRAATESELFEKKRIPCSEVDESPIVGVGSSKEGMPSIGGLLTPLNGLGVVAENSMSNAMSDGASISQLPSEVPVFESSTVAESSPEPHNRTRESNASQESAKSGLSYLSQASGNGSLHASNSSRLRPPSHQLQPANSTSYGVLLPNVLAQSLSANSSQLSQSKSRTPPTTESFFGTGSGGGFLSRLMRGSAVSQFMPDASQHTKRSSRSRGRGSAMTAATLRSSIEMLTGLFQSLDSMTATRESGTKYNGISCTEYEIHVRAEQTARDQQRSLAHMLVMFGDTRGLSIAGRLGILYQKFLRWLALCVVMFMALRLAWPRICFDNGWTFTVDFLYYLSSYVYVVLALPIRVLFTVIDLRKGREFYDLSVVLRILRRSPGVWLDISSSLVLFLECIGLLVDSEPHESWRVLLVIFRSLCCWRAFHPIIRVRTTNLSLFGTITKLLLVLLMVVHFMACGWAYLATIESDVGVRQWTEAVQHSAVDSKCMGLYASSFYFIGYSITATGYGDVLPANEFEQIFAVLVMITGTFLIAQICASLNWATKTHNFRRAQHVSKVSQIAAALETLGTHRTLSSRVFALLEYIALRHREAEVKQHLHDFSPPLQLEFRISRYDGLLRRCPLFMHQPREVLQLFIHELNDHVFLPSDYVFWAGDMPSQLFFVRIGQVATFKAADSDLARVRTSNASVESETEHLQRFYAGDHFGEVPVLTGQHHTVSAKALIYCILGTLSQEVFDVLLKTYPEAFLNLLQGVLYTSHTTSSISWNQLSAKLTQRFGDRDTAFSAMLPKSGPKVESSVIPISRFISTLAKIGVSKADAQSLWLAIDFPRNEANTSLTYTTFCHYITMQVDVARKKRRSHSVTQPPKNEDEAPSMTESGAPLLTHSGTLN